MLLKLRKKILSSKKWEKVFLFCGIFVLLTFIVVLAIPFYMRPKIHESACCENLQKIDGAKQQWALEQGKKDTDIPTWNDLVNTDSIHYAYLKRTPVCPRGGTYTIGAVAADTVCSLGQVKPSWFSWKKQYPEWHRLP
jgi:hypothetical protein